MSLTWNMENVSAATREATDANTIQAMVFGCIPVGIGSITEENAGEWFARHKVWSLAHELSVIPRETVDAFIGLKTNASYEDESRVHWLVRVIEPLLDELGGQRTDEEVQRFAVSVVMDSEDDDVGLDEYGVDRALRAGMTYEPDMLKVEGIGQSW